jgi:hypothetical protein
VEIADYREFGLFFAEKKLKNPEYDCFITPERG